MVDFRIFKMVSGQNLPKDMVISLIASGGRKNPCYTDKDKEEGETPLLFLLVFFHHCHQ